MTGQLLLNASNLHSGGGVAVATSVLAEVSRMPSQAERCAVLASSEVAGNLSALGTSPATFASFHVFDTHGIGAARTRLPVDPARYSAVVTVFGPNYWLRQGRRRVVGFAQPWVAYPRNEAYRLLPRREAAATRSKYKLVAAAFTRADCLIVEADHVKQALHRLSAFKSKRIEVVPNVPDAVHFDSARWAAVPLPRRSSAIRLGVVTRNYPHKNLEALPAALRILREDLGIDAEFWVTFSPSEYARTSRQFKESVRSVGSLALNQAPTFYRQLDGVVFPSLLECYSATPIEALAARVPLFASDRDFVRDNVGVHANYFNPLDPGDIAQSIAEFFKRPASEQSAIVEAGYAHVSGSTYTSADRALALLRIADDLAGSA